MLKRDDFEQAPCTCPICHQAGVSDRPQLRSPRTGAMLHGYDLKRTYAARDRFWALVEGLRAPTREPGSDG